MNRPTAKRVLVIDDEKTILLSLGYALKLEGIDVITCNRAEWAEKALSDYDFELVITDLRLSKTNDLEGMRIIELTKEKHPGCKIIVMTAFGSDEVRDEVKRLGADAYFDKPIDLEQLRNTIDQFGITGKRTLGGSSSSLPTG